MNKLNTISLLSILLFSCSTKENSFELEGIYKLIEIYTDNGSGQGSISPVDSQKIITFHPDGAVFSNWELFSISIDTANISSGTFSLENNIIQPNQCENPDYNFTIDKFSNTLIINYLCFEQCSAKYIKI